MTSSQTGPRYVSCRKWTSSSTTRPSSSSGLDPVLGDHGLAAAGGCRDDHVVAGVEGVERLELEAVERERVAADDLGPLVGVGAHGASLSGARLPAALAALEEEPDEVR